MSSKSTSKQEMRANALKLLKNWHETKNVLNFPKRFGISTNEKKFREVSFRVPEGLSFDEVAAEDFIVRDEAITNSHGIDVARDITYRVWFPSASGRVAGRYTIRFNLFPGIVGIIKIGKFFVAVENDNFPLQTKNVSLPRMFGATSSKNLNELGLGLLKKEYPFLEEYIEKIEVTQLGNPIYQDPSTRRDIVVTLFIECTLTVPTTTKEEVTQALNNRNEEMLLHHVFTEKELREIYEGHMLSSYTETIGENGEHRFRDHFSCISLASYFNQA